MSITLDVLHRAQRLDAQAISQIVQDNYAPIHRIAHGLAGRPDVARGVLSTVVGRALRALPHWRDEGAPQRWFQHQTILTARRAARPVANPIEDPLVLNADAAEPAYVAFVRALRSLSGQQREAFLRHHAEHLTMRQVAIAMDCSMEAANTHLAAGRSALKNVAGADFERFSSQLASAFAKLTPTEDAALPAIDRQIRRFVWPRRIWRILSPLLVLTIIAALAYGAWKLYQLIEI
jgi:DNA-directed RNA polymerase specialized sigma24 family protein